MMDFLDKEMTHTFQSILAITLSLVVPASHAGDYTHNAAAQAFVKSFTAAHNWSSEEVQAIIDKAERKQFIIDAMARPAEKVEPWHEYKRRVNRDRIVEGDKFWRAHEDILRDVENTLGVEASVIVGIIGFETRYGRITGNHNVLDALATLSFDYPDTGSKARREKFFQSELENFLLLSREEQVDPLTAKGSYAGAMGYGQFMPSSYRNHAIDFDKDGKRDLWNSKQDIIASVANYLLERGNWQKGQPVAVPVTVTGNQFQALLDKGTRPSVTVGELTAYGVNLEGDFDSNLMAALIELEGEEGPEYWVTFNNFYAIFSYNPRNKYAMAVFQLAEAVKQEKNTPVAD